MAVTDGKKKREKKRSKDNQNVSHVRYLVRNTWSLCVWGGGGVLSVQTLEAYQPGVETVLRLERHAWSILKCPEASNETRNAGERSPPPLTIASSWGVKDWIPPLGLGSPQIF